MFIFYFVYTKHQVLLICIENKRNLCYQFDDTIEVYFFLGICINWLNFQLWCDVRWQCTCMYLKGVHECSLIILPKSNSHKSHKSKAKIGLLFFLPVVFDLLDLNFFLAKPVSSVPVDST